MSAKDKKAKSLFPDGDELATTHGLGPPTSKKAALLLIKEFEARRVQSMWPHMWQKSFAEDLRERILDPDGVNQETTGLCGVVAMVRIWAYELPEKFVAFAIDLFERGEGLMAGRDTHSSRKVRPSVELRTSAPPPGMNYADWIVSASIRESLNWVFNYTPGEGIFQIKAFTWPGDPAKQFEALGYTHIKGSFTPGKCQGYESLMKASDLYQRHWRVVMLIDAALIDFVKYAGLVRMPNHYVGLNSPIVPRVSSGAPSLNPFKIWTWGRTVDIPSWKGPVPLQTVISNFYGFVAGKF